MEKDNKMGTVRDVTESTAALTGVEDDNPNSILTAIASAEHELDQEQDQEIGPHGAVSLRSTRTPFTDLSQIDADEALARTLQEQERAYMMLRMNGELSDYESWEGGSYDFDDEDVDPNGENGDDYNSNGDFDSTSVAEVVEENIDDDDDGGEDDAFDVNGHADDTTNYDYNSSTEMDPSAFSSDEAYARALQDDEEQELATRMLELTGINDRGFDNTRAYGVFDDIEYHGDISQDMWGEIDPDELSYEELVALGEVVGNENHGLAAEKIATLPTMNYRASNNQDGNNDSCVICRLDYEDGDMLTVLYCKHSYHADCLNQWLQLKKVCPVCSAEVTGCGNVNQ